MGKGLRGLAWTIACLLVFTCAKAAAADYRIADDPPPPTIEALLEGSKGQTASDGLRYLAVIDDMDLSGAKPAWHRRVGYDVMHERGLATAGQFSIDYQPAFQEVVLHAIDVWRDGVRSDRRGDSRIEVLRRESDLEAGLLDGSLTLSVTIPDIRVGDRVEYRYTIHGYNPVFGRGYHDYWHARYGVPVALREVRIAYPRSWPMRMRADVPGFEQDRGEDEQARWWRVRGRNLVAVDEEDGVPGGYDPLGRIEVSTAEGWGDVVRWALPLYPGRFDDRALAAELAAQLQLDPADPAGSAERATAFVQGQVRYTGLDMGLNSHAPNRPELVVQRRFGDCKDKSQLLVALLREAGIAAEPVLVNTERLARTANSLPSPLAFDHVVVRAHLPQGEVWIDPTRDRERGPFQARTPLQLRAGLPVSAGVQGLVEIPYPFPAQPEVEVDQRIDFNVSAPKAVADLTVKTTYRHGYAGSIRERFDADGAQKIGEGYLAYMRDFYDGLESSAVPELEELDNETRVNERYRLEWDTAEEGSSFGVIPFQLLDWAVRLAKKERRAPLSLSGPRFARHTVRSHHPGGWDIEKDSQRVENPWFRFDRQVRLDADGDFVVVAEWRRLADEIPAEGYARARKDIEQVRDLLQYDVDVAVDASPAWFGTGWRDWVWPVAALALGLIVLVLAWWLRNRWVVAGMLYRPRATVASRLLEGRLAAGLWIGLCVVLVEVMFERGHKLFTEPSALAIALVVGGVIGLFVRWVFMSWVLQVAMGMFGHDAQSSHVRRTYGLAMAPVGLFVLLSMVALGFRTDLLDSEVFVPEQFPSLATAVLLLVVGLGWWLLSLAGGCAGLAGTRTRRGVLIVGTSVLPLVALAMVVIVAISLR